MSKLEQFRPGGTDVAQKADTNPEGKGLNGFLLDWYRTEPRGVVAKPQRQVLAEFFTSMLVLSAKFKYEPVVGSPNYLYWINGEWSLSLIGPHEWTAERRRAFAGTCILQRDMTWTIEPSALLGEENPVSDAVARFYDAFAHMLDSDLTLEEILPFHVQSFHYYPRLYASALGRSIRGAVTIGGQTGAKCRDWQASLPRLDRLLLPR